MLNMDILEEQENDYLSTISVRRGSLNEILPPCDKYNCPKKQECKESLLACEAFHFYVQTNRSLPPTYTWKTPQGNSRAKVQGIDSKVIKPTMKRYWKIYKEDN